MAEDSTEFLSSTDDGKTFGPLLNLAGNGTIGSREAQPVM
jgi:hypothetical protein